MHMYDHIVKRKRAEYEIEQLINNYFNDYIELALQQESIQKWYSKKKKYEYPIGLPTHLLNRIIESLAEHSPYNKITYNRIRDHVRNKSDCLMKYDIKLYKQHKLCLIVIM